MDAEPLSTLRRQLREQCSFRDIANLIVAETPIVEMRFTQARRHDRVHTRFGGRGHPVQGWYVPEAQIVHLPGWVAHVRWACEMKDSWVAQRLFGALGLINGDPNMRVNVGGDGRTFTQEVTLFADDFPGMWLADKLRGRIET